MHEHKGTVFEFYGTRASDKLFLQSRGTVNLKKKSKILFLFFESNFKIIDQLEEIKKIK